MRIAARWMVTFVGFPLGGFASMLVVGPIDDPWAAAVGGLITGLAIGVAQALGLSRGGPPPRRWIAATALGMTVGLTVGAAVVDYATDLTALVVQGVGLGLAVGTAQAFTLRPRLGRLALAWPAALAASWAIGWAVTTVAGVQVDQQFTVFGLDRTNERKALCSPQVQRRSRQLVHASGTSITQRLARVSALHPWRIVTVWGLILAASVLAIGTLIGSAFNSDGSITSNPDSVQAEKVLGDNFSQEDRIDDAVVIYSAGLTSDAREFKAFVAGVRSSIEDTGATEQVRDPYAAAGSGLSEDGHAAVVTLVLGPDPEVGMEKVLDKVAAAELTPLSRSTSPASTPSTTTSPSSPSRT